MTLSLFTLPKHLKEFTCFSLVFLLFCELSYGQKYHISLKKYGVDDGLSSRSIQSFYQDKAGFLWIATFYGLNRFDGRAFKSYFQESHGLFSNNVAEIAEDHEGFLWLRHTSVSIKSTSTIAISRFDPRTEKVTTPATISNLDASTINRIRNTPDRRLLVATSKGTLLEWVNNAMHSRIQLNDRAAIRDFIVGEEGIWVQTDHSIRYFNKEGKRLRKIDIDEKLIITLMGEWDGQMNYILSEITPISHRQYYYQCDLSKNDLALKTQEDIFKEYNLLTRQPNSKILWWAVKDANNKISITNDSGEILALSHSESIGESAFNFCYNCSFFDKQGNMWNSSEDGLYKLSFQKNYFKKSLHGLDVYDKRSYGARGITKISGSLMLVNGLGPSFIINLKGEVVKKIKKEDFPGKFLLSNGKNLNLDSNERLGAYQDQSGNTWVSNQGGVLYRFDKKHQISRAYYYEESIYDELSKGNSELIPTMHWSIAQDQYAKIWLGHRKGLSYLDPTDSIIRHFTDYGNFPQLGKSVVLNIQPIGNLLWLGTTSGIYLFDSNRQLVIDHFHSQSNSGKKIPHDVIPHFYNENDTTIWLASKGGGLIKWNPKKSSYQQFTIEHGLSDNVIYAVYPDAYGNLWLSSNNGIMQFNKRTHSIRTFLEADGVSHEEFNTISHCQLADGTIYFGGINGITFFHPRDFFHPPGKNQKKLIATALEIQQQKHGNFINGMQRLDDKKEININSDELGFILRFAYLDFKSDQRSYSYKIAGYDHDWNYIDIPEVRINALPYGQYQLLLRAQGVQGNWSQPLSIPLIFISPFYYQLWFYLTVLFLGSMLIYLGVRWRISFLKKQQQALEVIVAERTLQISVQAEELKTLDTAKNVFFANVSHELRTPLSLVIGHLERIQRDEKSFPKLAVDIVPALRNGRSMAKLVDSILDLARLDAHKIKINSQPLLLKPFLKQVFDSHEVKAQQLALNYQSFLTIEESLEASIDPSILETILNNLLSNAIKYSKEKGSVTLKANQENKYLLIGVTDDGIGIPKNDLSRVFERYYQAEKNSELTRGGLGIGLALSHELTTLIGGKLTVKSQQGEGSTFSLKMPLKIIATSIEPKEKKVSHEQRNSTGDHLETATPILEKDLYKQGVLVVEDNQDMRQFIVSLLNPRYLIYEAKDSLNALDILQKNQNNIQLMICDYMMPGMNGMTLLNKVKVSLGKKHLPFIMLTARTNTEDKLHALSLGVDEYLTKPFSQGELLARVNFLMEKQKKQSKIIETDGSQDELVDMDLIWLNDIQKTVVSNLHNPGLSVSSLADKFFLSERQFYRKLKNVTGLSPKEYIKEARLIKALKLLEKNETNSIAEVALTVGFQTTDYFSKLFLQRFGKKPSEFQRPDY